MDDTTNTAEPAVDPVAAIAPAEPSDFTETAPQAADPIFDHVSAEAVAEDPALTFTVTPEPEQGLVMEPAPQPEMDAEERPLELIDIVDAETSETFTPDSILSLPSNASDPKAEAEATRINEELGATLVPMSHPDNGTSDLYKTDAKGNILVPASEAASMFDHGFVVADNG